jgi:hypothetical protein
VRRDFERQEHSKCVFESTLIENELSFGEFLLQCLKFVLKWAREKGATPMPLIRRTYLRDLSRRPLGSVKLITQVCVDLKTSQKTPETPHKVARIESGGDDCF